MWYLKKYREARATTSNLEIFTLKKSKEALYLKIKRKRENYIQLAITLKYVHDKTAKIKETFISYIGISADGSTNGLFLM